MSELKPCPFCGKSEVYLGEPKNEDEYGVMCNSCGAEGGLDEDGEFSISLWNARPIEDALQARIAELEKELGSAKKKLTYILNMETNNPSFWIDWAEMICELKATNQEYFIKPEV